MSRCVVWYEDGPVEDWRICGREATQTVMISWAGGRRYAAEVCMTHAHLRKTVEDERHG